MNQCWEQEFNYIDNLLLGQFRFELFLMTESKNPLLCLFQTLQRIEDFDERMETNR
jgi:hypothetical protein